MSEALVKTEDGHAGSPSSLESSSYASTAQEHTQLMDEPWQCLVKLRLEKDVDGALLKDIKETPFGQPINDRALVEERLRRAQLAVLNPSSDSTTFLSAHCDLSAKPQLNFSTNLVCVEITGPGVPSLSFVDLPGFISNAAKGEEDSIDLIRNLAKETIKGGNCLILLTLTMTEDIQTQYGAMLSREVDEKGERTIGVLTKPDAVQEGDLGYWQDVLLGQVQPLRHGYFVVKNPSTKDLDEGITYGEARAKERLLFQRSEWLSLPSLSRERLGTEKLVNRLSSLLETFIRKRTPKLTEQIRKSLNDVQVKLDAMPTEIGQHEAIAHVDRLCRAFASKLQDCVAGSIKDPELIQSLRRRIFARFRNRIRLTAPIILPVTDEEREEHDEACESYTPLEDDSLEDICQKMDDLFEGFHLEDDTHDHEESDAVPEILTLSDIRRRKEDSITRELPGNTPYPVKVALMQSSMKAWRAITTACFTATKALLLDHVKELIGLHFGEYESSPLRSLVTSSLCERIDERGRIAFTALMQIIDFEETVDTANLHYFVSTRASMVEALQNRRDDIVGTEEREQADVDYHKQQAISHLRSAGINVELSALVRLSEAGEYHEELELCAEMLAYWKVAYKRVIDMVPGMLDVHFVRKVADEALECLHASLGIQQKDAMERCVRYLQEDDGIVVARNELKARRARLQQGLNAICSFETRLRAAN
ncbi:uncharacterized protein PSFLO_05390 [Pseudozyma flocculosa]|uniref:GED domain-containing protein n=1 Tax=Pseudozyma flocculosa TaxID=84751 RepID=A0A5C3F962_9BASI|nr:uncharacterized protein PSFLO_05390 [Pseudozyma flocculosa]